MHPITSLMAMTSAALLAAPGAAAAQGLDDVLRGAYLVKAFGCVDCHTPMAMGPKGPAPDRSRGLSGHPQDMTLPPAPAPNGPWRWGGAASNTAYWGPWGVSYASNLTPDPDTGIGTWRSDDFVNTLRRGKHLGAGRALLPPMPWQALGQMNDRDLRAMFAYLKAQPAVRNQVPQPTLPNATAATR